MKSFLCSLLLFPVSVCATTVFAELGAGRKDGCIANYWTAPPSCSSNPIGVATIGIRHKGLSFQVDHFSTINKKDSGINVFSIRYRWEWRLE